MKVCKFYDMWCNGERSCEGCKHNKEFIEFSQDNEIQNDIKNDIDVKENTND